MNHCFFLLVQKSHCHRAILSSILRVVDICWGVYLCSEGPMFRGSYVPSFIGKARNIGPSEYRPFYPLVRSYVPRVLYSAVLKNLRYLEPFYIAVKLMGGATNL